MSIAGMFDVFPTRCRQNYNSNQIQIMVHPTVRNTAGAPFSASLRAPPLKAFQACQRGKRSQEPKFNEALAAWIQRTPSLQRDIVASCSAALVVLEMKALTPI